MSRFLVLLRAVNVAGKNRVPMAELRDTVDGLGYSNVATYLQSGNLVLTSTKSASAIEQEISECVQKTFGLNITVIVRSANELATVVADFPFADSAPNQAGVVFLDRPVQLDDATGTFSPDRLAVADSAVYVDCPSGFGKTKLTVSWIEREGNCRGTRRNWKTVLKLASMVNQV